MLDNKSLKCAAMEPLLQKPVPDALGAVQKLPTLSDAQSRQTGNHPLAYPAVVTYH